MRLPVRYAALALVLVASCAKDDTPAIPGGDGGTTTTMTGSGGAAGSGAGGGGNLVPCLERSPDLPAPPTKELPCELLPPGFSR